VAIFLYLAGSVVEGQAPRQVPVSETKGRAIALQHDHRTTNGLAGAGAVEAACNA